MPYNFANKKTLKLLVYWPPVESPLSSGCRKRFHYETLKQKRKEKDYNFKYDHSYYFNHE